MPISRGLLTAALLSPLVAAGMIVGAAPASANVAVTQVSTGPFTDAQAQHRTEVEPDTYSFGNTIVSAFQIGRVFGGGASDVGFATSTDGGVTWVHGSLPGLTTNTGGPYAQASDASVAFDARHNVWLISSLGIRSGSVDVLTSRSTNGGVTWSNPVTTATGQLGKNWIACDNTPTRPLFGNRYTQFDITNSGDAGGLPPASGGR